jgi:hypothetical protein
VTAVQDVTAELRDTLAPTDDEKAGIGSMLSDISDDLKTLMRQEVELAKAEIQAEVAKVGKGAGMFAGAAFAGLMVIIFLSTALWWALSNVMDQSWAALIVAALWIVIGAVLFVVGRSTVKSISFTPTRTINSLKQIPAALKGSSS